MLPLNDISANETRRVVQLGFAGILLLVFIYAITSLYHIRESTNHLTEIVEINNELVTELYIMRDVIRQRQILLNQMLASNDPFEVEELSLVFFDLARPFRQARENLQQLPINKNEIEILSQLVNIIRISQPTNQQAVESMISGLDQETLTHLVSTAQHLQTELMKIMEELIQERKINEKEFVAEGKSSYETVFLGSFISAFFIIILIFMIARIITVSVSKKNQELMMKNSELERLTTMALEATHTKSAFLATMSHEIRTPLTAIIGFAEINLEHSVSEENRERYTRSIVRNGRHLLQIINDILDISKIEANHIEFEKRAFSLFQVLNEVKQIIYPQIKDKGLDLNIDYDYPLPEKIIGDQLRLKQLLLNICINAIKFTDSGRINIKISCDYEKQTVSFEIVDTGIGMTEDQVETIFDVFTQADSSITRKYGGTGLGLALAKQFAVGMGGKIVVDSLINVGSRFVISVDTGDISEFRRLEAPPALSKSTDIQQDSKKLIKQVNAKILLAEDNIDNQQLFSILLEKTGADVTIAHNGLQAVEKAMSNEFDLIFMDMQMPVMDGLEATRSLRRKGYTKPIVSLTANAMKQDKEACYKAGCDDYIAKPVNKLNFYYTLYKYVETTDLPESDQTMIDNDPDIIHLKMKFIDSLPTRLNEINTAFNNKEYDLVKRDIHKLKGLGGSFDCPELTEVSVEIEISLIENNIAMANEKLLKLNKKVAYIMKKYGQEKVS